MHKFFKGLARAFRCQAQTSTRNTSTTSTQQDGVDDTSTGAQQSPRTRCVDGAHFLRGWHFDDGGRAISAAMLDLDQPAAHGQYGQPPHSTWLSLPPGSPACIRRIQSIKELALHEVRVYLASAASTDGGSMCTRLDPLFAARRWLLGLANRWLADSSFAGVAVSRSVLSASTASSSVTASGHARLVLASDVKPGRSSADRSATAFLPTDAVLHVAGTAAGTAARHRALRFDPGVVDGSRAGRSTAAASSPPSTFSQQSSAGAGAGTVTAQDRAGAEASLDAAVRQLLDLIEVGNAAGGGPKRSVAAGRTGDLEQQRMQRRHPTELDLERVPADTESSCRSSERIGTNTTTANAAPINPAASFNLGLCYEHGWGVPVNKTQAAECYRRASLAGHLASCYNLAQLYLSGAIANSSGGQSTSACARQLMEQAANGDLAEAQTWLGAVSFEEGRYGAAFKLFEKAAKQNNSLAQHYLGVCYENGFGIDASLETAAGLYKKAAAAGVTDAQYNLGVFYSSGLGGMPRDLVLAKDMFAQANRGGHAPPSGGSALLPGHRNSSTSKLCTIDSDSDSSSRGSVHKRVYRQLSKSASLPSFCYRINKSSVDVRDVVRGRSGAVKIELQGIHAAHPRNPSVGSDACSSPASPSSEHGAERSTEHLFYIGDDDDMSDGSSQFTVNDDDDDDDGQSLPADDFPADAFGESLSNPQFGSSLLVA